MTLLCWSDSIGKGCKAPERTGLFKWGRFYVENGVTMFQALKFIEESRLVFSNWIKMKPIDKLMI
jgi:hypothetical protein